jgi:hypothetical protein
MEDWSPNLTSRDRRVPAGNDVECAQTVYRLDSGFSAKISVRPFYDGTNFPGPVDREIAVEFNHGVARTDQDQIRTHVSFERVAVFIPCKVCHKCAVRFDPTCAKSLLFNT